MTSYEQDAWLRYGGGNELWRELYEPFNLIPVRGGNSGVQMFGWFNKEINSGDDLKGLKMRIPGLGGRTRVGRPQGHGHQSALVPADHDRASLCGEAQGLGGCALSTASRRTWKTAPLWGRFFVRSTIPDASNGKSILSLDANSGDFSCELISKLGNIIT